MAGRWTSLGFLHACTSQIISNETTLTFQGSIDENNTWISVKCLSKGSELSGNLFKNVKYSACLFPINQWYFVESFSSKKNENLPNVLIKSKFIFLFDMFWYLLFAEHSLITHMPGKMRTYRCTQQSAMWPQTRSVNFWLFKTTCQEEKISQQSSSHLYAYLLYFDLNTSPANRNLE